MMDLKENNKKTEILESSIESIVKEYEYKIEPDLLKKLIEKYSVLEKEIQKKDNKIKKISVTDYLTDLFNRYKIIEIIRKNLENFEKNKEIFSIIFFDIDDFRLINDTHGYDIGDMVLKNTSKLVKENLRRNDIFGRWEGDKFIIIMPFSKLKSAVTEAEKIREIIQNYIGQNSPAITCSFGVTEVSKGDDLDRIIKKVENLLYFAKRSGKNRVESI